MKLQALIIDDEPPARKKLRHFLKNENRIEIAGEAEDGIDAVSKIEELRPDLIFLDIQMPGLNGFEVLEALQVKRPQVIFTTAFDKHAVKAFEVRALDYLLKPFDENRFREAVERVFQDQSAQKEIQNKISTLIAEMQPEQKYLKRILLRSEGRISILKTEHIVRIEAEEKYVRLYTGKESCLHRETMNALEEKLDPGRFVRIHRSQIVNMERIKEIRMWSHGEYVVVMADETKLPLGRVYRENFLRVFEQG